MFDCGVSGAGPAPAPLFFLGAAHHVMQGSDQLRAQGFQPGQAGANLGLTAGAAQRDQFVPQAMDLLMPLEQRREGRMLAVALLALGRQQRPS